MGDITAASYQAVNSDLTFQLSLNVEPNLNEVFSGQTFGATSNRGGFSGATYTLVQQTPEPSSVTILGTGLGLAALWQLRQRRRRRA
jgi:PEP-CTERM motif